MSDGVVYEGQSLLTIKCDFEHDVTQGTALKIKYQKPDGTDGEWTATLEGTSTLVYEVQNGDIDQAGKWQLQPSVTIDGRVGYGKIATINFKSRI